MGWDDLFAELEAQFSAAEREVSEEEILELLHAEMTSIRLVDRLAGNIGAVVSVRLRTGQDRQGRIAEVNGAWAVLHDEHRRFLIPHAAIVHVRGLGAAAERVAGIRSKLTLGHGLRALARDGNLVQINTDAGSLRGRIGLVGADFCEISDAGNPLTLAWRTIVEVQPLT